MRFPDRDTVWNLRAQYPQGTLVELVEMNDLHAPPIGTLGVVQYVDDAGNIHVNWEDGCTLSVAWGADACRKIGGAYE